MALIVDQQSNFKHYCKICKKGFGCGRALGWHMRAHGIGYESGHIDAAAAAAAAADDDDQASDWDDKLGANNNNVPPPSNKRMYALRANPNRLKSCRVCENCGKEFLSWKSFLEHGKCSTSEDAESLVSSPGSDGEHCTPRRGCGWSKRKRSLRAQVGNFNSNCPSSEEEDLANCLMMLSNATVDPLDAAKQEESCASASKEEQRIRNTENFIAPNIACRRVPMDHKAKGVANNKGLFECKACKKVFNSHQALGGHRASHKKVKGCFAARLDHKDDCNLADDQDHDVITQEELFFPTKSTSIMKFDHHGTKNNTSLASSSKRKSKVHECSICHRVFSSGQALGGHKRCHWITSNSTDTTSFAKFQQYHHHDHGEQIQQRPKFIDNSDPLDFKLDLNLPAPDDDRTGGGRRDIIDNQHNQNIDSDQTNCNTSIQNYNVDNEVDNKVKLAKLSELKDMNISGGSTPWLQVGIGSTTDVEADP